MELLRLEDLSKTFRVAGGLFGPAAELEAVSQVSLAVVKGECLGLVGESGCGKTTLGRMIVGLERPDKGRVVFEGRDLAEMSRAERRAYPLKVQMIFQDPYSSLNPRRTVGAAIGEGLAIHGLGSGAGIRRRVGELMEEVGLSPGQAGRLPHEFSGGQRQRVGIARALALEPELIVADEPVSALDVSIQAQVVNLLADLKDRFGLTYIFIAHDLSLIRHVSDRIAVMYLGRLVEVVEKPLFGRVDNHPYTKALIESLPAPRLAMRIRRTARAFFSEPASGLARPRGCAFHPRCAEGMAVCREKRPLLREIAPGWLAACHRR